MIEHCKFMIMILFDVLNIIVIIPCCYNSVCLVLIICVLISILTRVSILTGIYILTVVYILSVVSSLVIDFFIIVVNNRHFCFCQCLSCCMSKNVYTYKNAWHRLSNNYTNKLTLLIARSKSGTTQREETTTEQHEW